MIVLDENLPERAARMLDAFDAKHEVRHMLEFLPKGSTDVDLLAHLARMKPVPCFLSQDSRIMKRPTERQALKAANLTMIFLATGWTSLPWDEKAWRLLKAWPKIMNDVDNARNPTVFEVAAGGNHKVNRISLTSQL